MTSATPQTATTSYLTSDTLGSPRVITDQTGNVTSRRDFMPFGEEIAGLGNRTSARGYQSDSTRQKFTGYERDDETEEDFAQARYYNSKLGRFNSVDPLMASADIVNPQTFNRYAYVGNNPINITDPTGTIWGISGNTVQWFGSAGEMIKAGYNALTQFAQRLQSDGSLVVFNPYAMQVAPVADATEAIRTLAGWGATGAMIAASGEVLGLTAAGVATILAAKASAEALGEDANCMADPQGCAQLQMMRMYNKAKDKELDDLHELVPAVEDQLSIGNAPNPNDEIPDTAVNQGGGKDASYGSDTIRQNFTGYEKDTETGLDYAEARYYNNAHGRFTAVDPLLASGKSADPQTFNRYIYVGNNPINITDPTGLDWGSRNNTKTNRTEYQWFDGAVGDGWSTVDFGFGNSSLQINNVCENGSCNGTAYLYKYGGWDHGERLQQQQSLANFFVTFSATDPKQIGVRNAQVRAAASDVMWSGAAVYNAGAGTYNLGAGAANYFGGGLPYAPEITPDENTTAGGNLFYYGTNAAMLAQGGASLYRGARNFFSLEGVSNLASPARTRHILAGDATGGGHAWFRSFKSTLNGITGKKDMFPITWSNKKIMSAISEVGSSPRSTWINQTGRPGAAFTRSGAPATFKVTGVFSNRQITVIVRGSDIITGY